MQKYKFSNPASVVVVSSASTVYERDPRNPNKIYDCLCRLFRRRTGPHITYKITAATPSQAARIAIERFRKEYGTEQPDI